MGPSAGRFLSRVVLIAVFLTTMTACAGMAEGPQSGANRNAGIDEAVFSEGYALIVERYLEPVAVSQLAMDGLTALGDADDSVSVTSSGGKVRVVTNSIAYREFPAPGRNDIDSWSELTAQVIKASRGASAKISAMESEKIYETVFDAALGSLDRYSRYATAEEARENRADREGFGGIGMHLSVIDGVTRIVAVIPNTPASRAGLKDNDIVIEVEGESIAGMELRDVVKRLRGQVGSVARFAVSRHGLPDPLHISVERERIIPTSVIYRREGNIAYIRITRFNQGTAKAFRKQLIDARKQIGPNMTGVIVDLRDNPGGLLDQAVEATDALLRGGRIVSTRGRHRGSFQKYDAGANDVANGLPVVLLINGGSASASEIMAAALQDDGRAIVIGSNSYGKGVVQSVYRLPNDGELTLTWSRFHAPSGYNLQDLGVLPTICTSNLKPGEVEALLAKVRSGNTDMAKTLANWRRESLPDKETRERLRTFCPSRRRPTDDTDRDLNIARTTLGDHALYAAALRQSKVPEVARRE